MTWFKPKADFADFFGTKQERKKKTRCFLTFWKGLGKIREKGKNVLKTS